MSARQAVALVVRARGVALGIGMALASGAASAQTPSEVAFAPGGQELFALDVSRVTIGGLRSTIELAKGTVTPLTGTMSVVTRNGRLMLRATERSELLITLPLEQTLPQNFTIEVDLIPRDGGPEPDLRLEGTRSINQGDGSAHLEVTTDATFGTIYIVGGESNISEFPIPDDVRATLPETFTRVGVSIEGGTIRFFINGREMLPDPEQPAKKVQARFARGNVLRVTLGGVTDGNVISPVYLARVRLATGAPVTVATALPATTPATITPIATAQPTLTTPTSTGAVASGPVARTNTGAPRATRTLTPPAGLSIAGTPAMATLTWQAPSDWTPTGYTVQRTTAGHSESTLLTTSAIRATRIDDVSGFVTGSSYEYVVTALSSEPLAFGTARATFQPPAPQNVSNVIAQQAGSDVGISWAPVPNATKYIITSGAQAMDREVPGTQNRVTYSGISPGTYTWTVGARYEPGPLETPATTWPSVTLDVLDPNPVLAEKKLYKEVSRPEIYLLLDGKKIHIPTPDALRLMGHTAADVTKVIDGALSGWRLFQFSSMSATPGSLVHPPRANYPPNVRGVYSYAPIRGVAGSTRVITQGLETYVVELRGWLWWKENINCAERDRKYGLEVDTDWAKSQGIDLHQILRVGNLGPGGGGVWETGSHPRRIKVRPLISMELNSFTWRDFYPDNTEKPADWDTQRTDCGERTYYFPFDDNLPEVNLDLVPDITAISGRGPYVRVVGTLLSDNPHAYTLADFSSWWAYNFPSPSTETQIEWNGAIADWHPGVDPISNPTHYARWSEIHPPDLIKPLPAPSRTSTMKAIGLAARPSECQRALLTLAPDDPRPSPTATIGWEEIRGPETYWPNGQNAQNGSWVRDLGTSIMVDAAVCGGGGSPGRFKAFYRVWWK